MPRTKKTARKGGGGGGKPSTDARKTCPAHDPYTGVPCGRPSRGDGCYIHRAPFSHQYRADGKCTFLNPHRRRGEPEKLCDKEGLKRASWDDSDRARLCLDHLHVDATTVVGELQRLHENAHDVEGLLNEEPSQVFLYLPFLRQKMKEITQGITTARLLNDDTGEFEHDHWEGISTHYESDGYFPYTEADVEGQIKYLQAHLEKMRAGGGAAAAPAPAAAAAAEATDSDPFKLSRQLSVDLVELHGNFLVARQDLPKLGDHPDLGGLMDKLEALWQTIFDFMSHHKFSMSFAPLVAAADGIQELHQQVVAYLAANFDAARVEEDDEFFGFVQGSYGMNILGLDLKKYVAAVEAHKAAEAARAAAAPAAAAAEATDSDDPEDQLVPAAAGGGGGGESLQHLRTGSQMKQLLDRLIAAVDRKDFQDYVNEELGKYGKVSANNFGKVVVQALEKAKAKGATAEKLVRPLTIVTFAVGTHLEDRGIHNEFTEHYVREVVKMTGRGQEPVGAARAAKMAAAAAQFAPKKEKKFKIKDAERKAQLLQGLFEERKALRKKVQEGKDLVRECHDRLQKAEKERDQARNEVVEAKAQMKATRKRLEQEMKEKEQQYLASIQRDVAKALDQAESRERAKADESLLLKIKSLKEEVTKFKGLYATAKAQVKELEAALKEAQKAQAGGGAAAGGGGWEGIQLKGKGKGKKKK